MKALLLLEKFQGFRQKPSSLLFHRPTTLTKEFLSILVLALFEPSSNFFPNLRTSVVFYSCCQQQAIKIIVSNSTEVSYRGLSTSVHSTLSSVKLKDTIMSTNL